MPKIERRGENYTVRVSLTDPLTGKRIQQRVTAKTKRLLDAEVSRVRAEFNSGAWVQPDKTTVAQWCEVWFATYRESGSSRRKRGLHIKNHIADDDIGRIPITRLRYAQTQSWVDRLVMRGLAPNTVKAITSTLSLAMTQAVKRQLIAANPCNDLDLPSAGNLAWTVLDDEQARRITADTGDEFTGAIWTLAVTLGLRRGELLVLRWEDVDLGAGVLRVQRTMSTDDQGRRRIKDGAKTVTSQRPIRLPQVCVDALRRQRAKQNERRLAAGELWQDGGYVFDKGLGERIGETAFYTAFRKMKARLDLPASLRVHDLRHTAATLMLYAGVQIPTVAKLLGHASPATTMRVYAHVLRVMEDEAADRIDSVFRPIRDPIVTVAGE